LRQQGHEVALILSGRDVEKPTAQGWSGAVMPVRCPAPRWRSPLGAARSVANLASAFLQARRQLAAFKPHALLAMGSYTSFGPVLAARSLRIPVVLHEANAVPGVAVMRLARHARAVAIAFDSAAKRLPSGTETVNTGVPVRAELLSRAPLKPDTPLRPGDPKDFTLLVMGGSLGARAVNELAMAALARLAGHPTPKGRAVPAAGEPGDQPAGHGWRVIHLAGRADENAVRAAYAEIGVSAQVFGFLEDMGAAYAAADLCIGRSGAAACFELALCGKPAILIPLPTAVRDHQTANAKAFEEAGAAIMMPQAELTPELLAAKVSSLRDSDGQLEKMSAAMRGLARPDAALALAITVERVGSHSL
jgi:UDP-N-acetylglucosamine--N-acetylmuramyl-(pentapeptide) pyrophosphoryl-undecaprenol N-acetylglucosamine transferase